MFKIRSFTFILFLAWQAGYSQQILNQPSKWQRPRWTGSEDTTLNTNKVWIVFSDRINNPTYENSTSKTVKKTVNYMEQFYVTEVQGSYLHIYKDGSEAEKSKQLGPDKEDYGWIKIEQLLPNQSCYMTFVGVDIKAILLNSSSSANRIFTDGPENPFKKGCFYKDPQLTQTSTYESSRDYIFYIYKRFPAYAPHKSFLLGKTRKFSAYDTGNIVGWVDASKVRIWNNRIALLPNTQPEAILERKSLNQHAIAFISSESAQQYGEKTAQIKTEMAIWNADSCWGIDHYSPYSMRFPVFSEKEGPQTDSKIFSIGIPISFDPKKEPSVVVKSYLSGLGLSKIEIADLIESNSSLFLTGFTPFKMKGHNYPLWEKQVLLNTDELYRLVHSLAKTCDNSKNESELRANIAGYFSHMGQNTSIEKKQTLEILELTIEEAQNRAMGLSGSSNLLQYKIKDIYDPTKVSILDLVVFTKEIENSYKILNSIYQGVRKDLKDTYIWVSNGNKYYWIPERLFP
jgi:hypothetical protein